MSRFWPLVALLVVAARSQEGGLWPVDVPCSSGSANLTPSTSITTSPGTSVTQESLNVGEVSITTKLTSPPTSSTGLLSPRSPTCALPSTPLTNEQQVGNTTWGTLCQPTFPRWLDNSDGTPYSEPPWGSNTTTTNSDATVIGDVPITNVYRSYNFTISRGRLSPDGVLRDMILINGQHPGPVIEANWGDWIVVTVNNEISSPSEGTALHWHGMLQRGSQWQDGTPAVSQCPIAPGNSYTYQFRAEIFGTSLYHAHYSAQYTGGVVGPMVIHGPSQQDYDIDLGPVMLSDWNHIPYFSMVSDVVGTDFSKIPPLSDNGLINGRSRFDCSQPSYDNSTEWLGSNLKSNLTWTCVDGAERAKFRFQSGKTHRLRLMNVGADGIHKFSIDGHTMTVIATDYVPTVPYTTDVVTLGVGQRTDVLVTADGAASSSYWMRTQLPGAVFCGGLGTPTGPNGSYPQVLAGVYYEAADTTLDPTTVSTVNDVSCSNQPLNTTSPEYAIAPIAGYYVQDIILGMTRNATGSFVFTINGQAFRADFNEPLLYLAAAGNVSYPDNPQWNVYNFGENKSVVLNVTNETPSTHPFHLHGHTFSVLNTGPNGTVWDGSTVNPSNPMRRDVQIVPQGGYAAIQFEADNPGVWPFHCHVAWHLSGGMSMNIMTRPTEVQIPLSEQMEQTCDAWQNYSESNVVDQIDSGS